MLTTRLLSKYLARQEAKREAKLAAKFGLALLKGAPTRTPMSPVGVSENLYKSREYVHADAQEHLQMYVREDVRGDVRGDAQKRVEEHFEPLTPQQAQMLIVRLRNTASLSSPFCLIVLQLLAGAIASSVALLVTGEKSTTLSVAYGALAVVAPASMFAWGVMFKLDSQTALVAGMRFFIWEVAKVGLTVAMLFAAPALVVNVSWLGLLAGFVVTMKVYWLAIWMYPARNHSV